MKEPDYKAIGRRIRAARKKCRMSQEALMDKVGLSSSHISHIESGKTKLSLIALLSIANALSTTTDSLLYDNIELLVDSYDKEFKDLLDDCIDGEKKVILEAARQVKMALKASNATKR